MATSVALFICALDASAATRKTVSSKESNQSIIKSGTTSKPTGYEFQTPNGHQAFFGAEYTDEHTAGRRFNAGDSVPAGGKKIKVPIKAAAVVSKAAVASKAKSIMKASVAGAATMAATAAVTWAIDQIPGASYDSVTGELKQTPAVNTDASYWSPQFGATASRSSSALYACQQGIGTRKVYKNGTMTPLDGSETIAGCWTASNDYLGSVTKYVRTCPNGHTNFVCNTTGPAPVPFTEADWSRLESTLSGVPNSEWLRDLINASCQGSLSPAACYDDLTAFSPLTGPASQLGPKTTSTSTTTNPDGTTSTSTTTSQDRFDYTFGDNYYDFTTTTTTTNNDNGQTTTTITDDSQPAGEEPAEDQEDSKEDEDLEPPTLNDPYRPVVDKYNSIATDVADSSGVPVAINASPWYSFGGTCTEMTLNLPIYGAWQTSYCQYIYDWVRPILSFLFIVFTYITCRDMFFETLEKARPT